VFEAARRLIRAVTILARDGRIPKPLRGLAAFGVLPIPGALRAREELRLTPEGALDKAEDEGMNSSARSIPSTRLEPGPVNNS
jgi:hypothetical protein